MLEIYLVNISNYLKNSNVKIMLTVIIWYSLFHIILTHACRDDDVYSTVLSSFNDFHDFYAYFIDRYFNWSCRTLAEVLTIIFTAYPTWIWKVFDVAAFSAFIWLLSKVINTIYQKNNDSDNLSASALFMIVFYPIFDMKTAGWITTSINYFWPMLCSLYMVLFTVRHISGINQNVIQIILFLVCTVYSGTFELISVFNVSFAAVVLFILFRNKIENKLVFASFIISLFFLVYNALCPGNSVRASVNIDQFSSWNLMNTIEHINIALCATFSRLTSFSYQTGVQAFLLYSVFNLLILLNIHKKYKSVLLDTLMFLPLIFTYLFNQVDMKFGSIWLFNDSVSTIHVGQIRYVYQPVLSVLLFCFNLIGLVLIFKNRFVKGINCCYLISLLYMVAFGTRFIMGLSCTVYASNTRTYIVLLTCLICICLLLVNEIKIFEWYRKEFYGVCSKDSNFSPDYKGITALK